MALILLYTASISQSGTNAPNVVLGADKAEISGSWSRLDTGSYKFTRVSGEYFLPISGGLFTQISTNTTSSVQIFISGSDSASLYLTTYSVDNTSTKSDNMIPSGSIFQISVTAGY